MERGKGRDVTGSLVERGFYDLLAKRASLRSEQHVFNAFKVGTVMVTLKGEISGMDNVAKNAALDSITGGLFSVGGMISENTKKCEKLVDATAKELSEMNL